MPARDLDELLASADRTAQENEASALRLGSSSSGSATLPKPVVALVQGRALAGGAGLATACDLVLVSRARRLGYPEIQRGFVPAMVTTLLRRLAGEKVALDLVLTGRLSERRGGATRRAWSAEWCPMPISSGKARAGGRGSLASERVGAGAHQAALLRAGRQELA